MQEEIIKKKQLHAIPVCLRNYVVIGCDGNILPENPETAKMYFPVLFSKTNI